MIMFVCFHDLAVEIQLVSLLVVLMMVICLLSFWESDSHKMKFLWTTGLFIIVFIIPSMLFLFNGDMLYWLQQNHPLLETHYQTAGSGLDLCLWDKLPLFPENNILPFGVGQVPLLPPTVPPVLVPGDLGPATVPPLLPPTVPPVLLVTGDSGQSFLAFQSHSWGLTFFAIFLVGIVTGYVAAGIYNP